ncbi:efflux RND transporter periplasmic adaptor subunit [Pelotomaculum sp. PtaB.Bin117]|uniref:efflux RND transporter periplasmic adaptor subunit n=1 Tax=Pelotomaculum sp. PtaB.Bin117 TaxID=1811694 RepID=UPI002006FD39|nr:efflux RND transporter periplasmic adaptor subunit [Pelotomaculum sp. PtaB.Bin117]
MQGSWKKWLWIPVLLGLALGLFKFSDYLKNNKQVNAPSNLSIQTVEAKEAAKVTKEETLSYTGTIEAVDEAVISAKIAGRVNQVSVENGDAVASGAVLVSLESQEYINAVTISRALLQKAEVNLSTVEVNYQRNKTLYESGAISKKDFEDIEISLKLAEAEVSSAAASLANAEESLRNCTVNSPIGGVVSDRNVSNGQVLSPGAQIMLIKNISDVHMIISVEQKDLASITRGMEAVVTLDSYPDRKFTGTVEIINPSANKSARVFETKIRINNKDNLLKPGMFAKAELKTGKTGEILAVPQNALTGKEGMFFVFTAEGDKANRRQVEIGQVVEQLVEIKSGLTEGQKVIITNVNKLKDQDSIKISD